MKMNLWLYHDINFLVVGLHIIYQVVYFSCRSPKIRFFFFFFTSTSHVGKIWNSLWAYKQASTTRHQYIQWTFEWTCGWCIYALVLSGPVDRLMDWVEKPQALYFLSTIINQHNIVNITDLATCCQNFWQLVENSLHVATRCNNSINTLWTLWS